MWLKLDADGMNIELRIRFYEPCTNDNQNSQWCCVDANFQMDNYINYFITNDEILMCSEVEALEASLTDFINGKIKEEFSIECIEPYFEFKFNPSRKLTEKDKMRSLYYSSDLKTIEPFVEWRSIIWDDCPTGSFISTPLFMNNVIVLRDYLRLVMGKIDKNSDEITEYVNTGKIYGQF